MSSSYLNMAAGAFLGTCFVAMTLSLLSGAIYDSPNPEKEGFVIKAEKVETAGTAAKKPAVPPIAPLLQKADAKKGAQVFKKCEACHDGTKGGPNKIGPNLWDVVGRPIATHPGFSYSSALKKFSDGGKKKWTYKRLNHWLHDPRGYVSGTAMTFPGVKEDQDRADVIAYLHTLSDKPVPFPKPEAKSAKPAAAGKKADTNSKAAAPAKSAADDEGAAASNSGSSSAGAASGQGKATGDQSTTPKTTAPDNTAPKTDPGNAGSQSGTQKAEGQNAGDQAADSQNGNGTNAQTSPTPQTSDNAKTNGGSGAAKSAPKQDANQ